MIGSELGVSALSLRGVGAGPPLLIDFTTGRYQANGATAASFQALAGASFARTGAGTALTTAGAVATFAAGAPRVTDRGLLLEAAGATNLMVRSQAFDQTWVRSNVSVTANQTVAPDGTVTADVVANATTSANSFYYTPQGVPLTQGAVYTFAVYAKPKTGSGWIWLLGENAGNAFAWFNLGAGQVGAVEGNMTASITPAANGFHRCAVIFTKTSPTVAEEIGVGLTSGNGAMSFTPSAAAAQEVYLWQADLIAGAGVVAPIPTGASAATRGADAASVIVPAGASAYEAVYGAANAVVTGAVTPGAAFDLVAGRPWVGLGQELKRLTMR